MKARLLRIHNFRSIADAEIELSNYALLVGPNNAGKSNVLAALRVFYEKGLKFEEERDLPKFSSDSECWVELEFQASESEFAQLKDEYRLPSERFRVRKYLKSAAKDDEGKTRNGIYAYVNGELSGSRFYGAKNVQQGKLGDVIFIPAASKLDDHTKLSGPSSLRDLISVVLKDVLASSPSYGTLQSAFEDFESKLKKETTSEGFSLESLETAVSMDLQRWGAKFELGVNSVSADDILKTLISHQVVDEALQKALDPSAFG